MIDNDFVKVPSKVRNPILDWYNYRVEEVKTIHVKELKRLAIIGKENELIGYIKTDKQEYTYFKKHIFVSFTKQV